VKSKLKELNPPLPISHNITNKFIPTNNIIDRLPTRIFFGLMLGKSWIVIRTIINPDIII
jgi:hypothetical protein